MEAGAQVIEWAVAAAAATVFLAPEALAFPYHVTIGNDHVYSERPIPPTIVPILARADALVAASPIAGPGYEHRIFLTDGSWRWHVLALASSDAFALSRPLGETIV